MPDAYSTDQLHTLSSLIIVGSILSTIGALFIIINYCLLKSLRNNFAFKLLLWVAITDLIDAIGSIVPIHKEGAGCTLQAIVKSFGDNASLGWVVAIAWTINHITKSTKLPIKEELDNLLKKMHIIIWSITILTTILPLTTNSYGVVGGGGWCWINEDDTAGAVWRYVTFYIPLWICIIYMIYIYCQVWNKLKHNINNTNTVPVPIDKSVDRSIDGTATANAGGIQTNRQEQEQERKKSNILQRMKYYPMILIVCYSFSSIRTISDDSGDGYAPYWLAVLHFMFESIIGFCDGIAYGLTPDIRKKDKELCGCYEPTVAFEKVSNSQSH